MGTTTKSYEKWFAIVSNRDHVWLESEIIYFRLVVGGSK